MQMKRWLLCVAAFLFLLPMMCTSVAHAGSPAANFFVAAEGRAAYDAALRAHFGACDAAEARRVEALLVPLAAAAQMDVPLVVISSSGKPNLYALPGAVVVNRGMLALVPDDGELSVLLAHELGHLALDHPVRGIRRSMRAQYFARRAAKAKNLDDGANDFVQAALHADVGLHEERKADEWAAALLPRAGITPAVAVGLWDHLASASIPDEPRAHPSYEERKRIYGNAWKEQRNDP